MSIHFSFIQNIRTKPYAYINSSTVINVHRIWLLNTENRESSAENQFAYSFLSLRRRTFHSCPLGFVQKQGMLIAFGLDTKKVRKSSTNRPLF